VNLRDMRSHPDIMRFLAEIYENPLRRLKVNRFVEVPDAVSQMAGIIAANTGIPVVTIREEAKQGRVVKGRLIGDLHPGERVAIIDDVITDGVSKLAALEELRAASVQIAGLVVLVDRQQGWQKKLSEWGFGNVGVWPAMTLHDIRKFLITKNLMQRCEVEIEKKNPLIVALDGKNWDDILPTVDRLRTTGCILKVNDLLLGEGIETLLPDLSVYGRVMADLKCHDIPNTVENICRRLRPCPPWAVTVHASGGAKMVAAAKKMLEGKPTKVLAVTVLTSIDPKTCEEIYVRQPLEVVTKLAGIASGVGADGFVCSPQEVKTLRELFPRSILVTPGIRSEGKDAQDQERIATPMGAAVAGANYLVMGRQIFESPDPVVEVLRILGGELGIEI